MTTRSGYSVRLAQLKSLAQTRTAKNSGLLFSGNSLQAVLSLVAVIIISRHLGPEQFGIFATFNAIWMTILALTDFGLGTSAIKFIARHLESNKRRAAIFMRVVFKLELACGLLIGILGLLFSKTIAQLLGGDNLLFAVRMAFVAGVFASASAFMNPFLIAYNQVKKITLVNAIIGFCRVLGVLLLAFAAILSLENVIWLYTAISLLLLVLALYVSPKDYLLPTTPREERHAFGEIFHFTKWIFLSTIATLAFGKIDLFLLSALKDSREVGLYAAAIQLNNAFPIIIGALGGALLPKASVLKTKTEYYSYVKKTTLATGTLVIFLLPVLFLSTPIIDLIFGSKFSSSVGAFRYIYIGYLFSIIFNPWVLVFYGLNKPQISTFINYVQLVLAIGLNLVFIPKYGLYAAAVSFMVSQFVGLILYAYFTRKVITKLPTLASSNQG